MLRKIMAVLVTTSFLAACEKPPVTSIQVETLKQSVKASGELESKQSQLIAPPSIAQMWQYQIKSLVPENSKVKEGQVIVSFDDKQVSDRLVEENGKLVQAKKELENKEIKEQEKEQELVLELAEKQMEFDKSERRAGIYDNSQSDNDREKSKIDFIIAEADLTLAQQKLDFHRKNSVLNLNRLKSKVARLTSEVDMLKSDIDRLKVKAPMSGMTLYRTNWQGEKPAVGESIQFGQPVLEVALIEEMQIVAQVAEPDSGKVKVGQVVEIYLDSAKDTKYLGKVVALGKVFRDKSYQDRSRVFDVIIDIDDIDVGTMKPGMTARLEIITQRFDEQYTVPVQALKQDDDGYFVEKNGMWGLSKLPVDVIQVVGDSAVINGDITKDMEVTL